MTFEELFEAIGELGCPTISDTEDPGDDGDLGDLGDPVGDGADLGVTVGDVGGPLGDPAGDPVGDVGGHVGDFADLGLEGEERSEDRDGDLSELSEDAGSEGGSETKCGRSRVLKLGLFGGTFESALSESLLISPLYHGRSL